MISALYKRSKLFLKFQWHKRLHNYTPLVALLFLVSRCNLKCNYCFAEHSGEFQDLPLKDWKFIIDKLKTKGCELIFLMGGEPLLYKNFGELIDYIHDKGMQCHLTTNGLLIPEYINELKKVDLLMVSLDGNKKSNDLNRGYGSFKQIIQGIEVAKESDIPLRINCVLTKNNKDDIEWLLNFGEEHNVYVGFTIPAKSKQPDLVKDKLLTNDEIRDIHTKLLSLKNSGEKITLSEKSLKHVISYPKSYDELIMKTDKPLSSFYRECMYGRYIVFIDAEGSIYPCTTLWEMSEVFTPKNIFRDGFDQALQNAQHLPCQICYCAGGVEWNFVSSFRGLLHSLKFARSQT